MLPSIISVANAVVEFIGEGMRWDDLKRWRSWDQLLTKPYIIEGINSGMPLYKDHKDIKDDGTL